MHPGEPVPFGIPGSGHESREGTEAGIVLCCAPDGGIWQVVRGGDMAGGNAGAGLHITMICAPESRHEMTRFFARVGADGTAASQPVRLVHDSTGATVVFIGMRWRDRIILVGASSPAVIGALYAELYFPRAEGDKPPVDIVSPCEEGSVTDAPVTQDTWIYEDFTRLNNELVNTSRALSEAQVRLQAQADALKVEVASRQKSENALREANRKLNLLSSITRHDVNNTLTGLRAYIELSKEMIPDPAIRAFIEKEEGAADTIFHQIEFTRFYQDVGMNEPVWHRLPEAIESAIAPLNTGPVRIVIDIPVCEIYADPMLDRVFYNLSENALRHGKQLTRIRFFTERHDTGLALLCEDDGVGVPLKKKTGVFTRQFFNHTGFGLYLSREILGITGCTITETGVPGTGARFEILVPEGAYRIPVSPADRPVG